jgi:sugar-specific transcriptional regulator TrmB
LYESKNVHLSIKFGEYNVTKSQLSNLDSNGEIKNHIYNLLKNRGIDEREAKIYCFLVREGSQTAGEISKNLRIGRVQTYRELKKLEEKGLVETIIENPVEYSPTPFKSLINSEIKQCRERVELLENYKERMLEYMTPNNTYSEILLPNRFSLVRGRKKFHSRVHQLIQKSEQELIVSLSNFGIIRSHQYGEIEEIDKQKKIQSRIIMFLSKENDFEKTLPMIDEVLESYKHIAFRYIDLDSHSRICGKVPFFYLSEKECLYLLDERNLLRERRDRVALWTNSKPYNDIQKRIFEEFWEKAKTLTPKCLWPD